MNWIDFTWPMISAACATLGVVHGVIWFKRRDLPANLAFAVAALSLAVIAILELLMMRAHSPQAYASILRLAFIPLTTLVFGLVGFLLLEFRVGSRPLAVMAVIGRAACLPPDFLTGANMVYLRVDTLQQVPAWAGASISIPGSDSASNPWFLLDTSADILLMLFIASVIVGLHRRQSTPERWRALVICYAMMLFVVFAQGWNFAVLHLGLHGPLMVSPAFLAFLALMGYELGLGMIRARELERGLSIAELVLADSRQQMDMAVSAAGVGLWSWDKSKGDTWFSDLALSILGGQPGEVFDMDAFRARLLSTDRKRLDAALQGAYDMEGVFIGEYRIVDPTGKRSWILVRGQVELAIDRTLLRVRGAIVDISQRKEAEDRFRLVVQAAPVAMLMFDPEGMIVLANAQAEKVFGHTVDGLIGMDVEKVVPEQSTHDHWQRQQKTAGIAAMKMAIGSDCDLSGRRRDGSDVPITVTLTPVPIESRLFMLAAITDLSETNRLEHELALQRDELAHLSRVALLSELSGSLAHELNQPLTAILANAQGAIRFLARDPPDLEEVRDGLMSIVESDKRAGEVIRRLRALLRKDHAELRYLDMNEVVKGVLKIIRGDLLNKNIDTVLELEEDLPAVCGDVVQLQQVLLNLIVNASDAMAGEDVRRITLRTVLAASGQVVVTVSDVGHGIPPQDMESIFTPFVTTKRDGLGLGLPVCRTIVNAHHGRIWAEDNGGRGTTLSFELPVGIGLESPGNGTPTEPETAS